MTALMPTSAGERTARRDDDLLTVRGSEELGEGSSFSPLSSPTSESAAVASGAPQSAVSAASAATTSPSAEHPGIGHADMRKNCAAAGTAPKRNMPCQWFGSSARGRPATTATRMPMQTMSWLRIERARAFWAQSGDVMGTRLEHAPMPKPASRRPINDGHDGRARAQEEPTKSGTATP